MTGKRYIRESRGGEWLNIYANMLIIFLAFFILLFSVSSLNAEKFNLIVTAFAGDKRPSDEMIVFAQGSDGAIYGGDSPAGAADSFEDAYNYLLRDIERNRLQDDVQVLLGEGYVFIRFMDEALFQPNSARLKNSNMEILNSVGSMINAIQTDVGMISVNAHLDDINEGIDYRASGRALSSDRANAVIIYLEDAGIDPQKLVQVAWGKNMPFEAGAGEAQLNNSRVEILISSDNLIGNQLANIYKDILF